MIRRLDLNARETVCSLLEHWTNPTRVLRHRCPEYERWALQAEAHVDGYFRTLILWTMKFLLSVASAVPVHTGNLSAYKSLHLGLKLKILCSRSTHSISGYLQRTYVCLLRAISTAPRFA